MPMVKEVIGVLIGINSPEPVKGLIHQFTNQIMQCNIHTGLGSTVPLIEEST